MTTDALTTARELILRPSGLDDSRLDRVFGQVLQHSVDFADLYFQLSREESWALEDGIVKDGSASIEQGVGVRALAGEKTGFAYSDEIDACRRSRKPRAPRARSPRTAVDRSVQAWHPTAGHSLYLPVDAVGLAQGRGKGRVARARGSRDAQARSAHRAGDGERQCRARSRAGRQQRGRARGGRAPARAIQCLRASRAERPS